LTKSNRILILQDRPAGEPHAADPPADTGEDQMSFLPIDNSTTAEIISGVILSILSFFFGHKHGRNKEKKKNLTATNADNFKDIKTL